MLGGPWLSRDVWNCDYKRNIKQVSGEREREREREREQIPQDFARRSRAHTLGHVHLQARFKDNHSPHYIRILRVRARGAAAATLFPQLRQFVYTVGDPCGFSRRARVPIGLPNWRPLCHANSERGGESERACIERREIAQQALCPPPPLFSFSSLRRFKGAKPFSRRCYLPPRHFYCSFLPEYFIHAIRPAKSSRLCLNFRPPLMQVDLTNQILDTNFLLFGNKTLILFTLTIFIIHAKNQK